MYALNVKNENFKRRKVRFCTVREGRFGRLKMQFKSTYLQFLSIEFLKNI